LVTKNYYNTLGLRLEASAEEIKKPIRSWEMRKREGAMTSNVDSLSKIMCFMKKVWITILLTCFVNFLKGVLM